MEDAEGEVECLLVVLGGVSNGVKVWWVVNRAWLNGLEVQLTGWLAGWNGSSAIGYRPRGNASLVGRNKFILLVEEVTLFKFETGLLEHAR